MFIGFMLIAAAMVSDIYIIRRIAGVNRKGGF